MSYGLQTADHLQERMRWWGALAVLYGSSSINSRSYAEDVTSVTSGASQGPHSFHSRSYAEDATSVTSGASQGPHSFNLVFVCLCVCFVCLCHAWRYPVSDGKKS